ncbi:hypothetical protein [Salidesulfovibrio onnuriiensis]|uniref:hypothetical protein n=1 Tax=Salidesulfovibrio onnuriiensis TaxID=2583823 RepID=UPI0011CCBD01|nr:hypothetical protein [Salidesulfovibrio onnuriiensis]
MTVSSTISRTAYSGNGSTRNFAIPFMFIKDSDLEIVLRAASGTEAQLSISTDYTLSGAGEQHGGVCSLNSAPKAGEVLVIRRNPAMIQEVDYLENDAFPAQSHESALDLLTMICQALSERLDRTVSLRLSSAVTGVEIPDPDPGTALVWNDSGDNLTNKSLVAQGLVGLPLEISQGGTGCTSAADVLAAFGGEPADASLLKNAKQGQSLEAAFLEPYFEITDAAEPPINLAARNRFKWILSADRTFPDLNPAAEGEWHFNVYSGGHALTLAAEWGARLSGRSRPEPPCTACASSTTARA